MQDDAQQEPRSRNSAGYRSLLPAEVASGMGAAAYAYVALAAALGMTIGLVLAVLAGHAKVAAAAPRASAPLVQSSSGMAATPAIAPKSAPSPVAQSQHRHKTIAKSNLSFPRLSHHATTRRVAFHRRRVSKFLDLQKNSRGHKVKRRPYVSPNPPPAPVEPTALQLATAAAANGPFFLGIQGDVTVASYDAATGTVQTYEGVAYVLAKASIEGNSIPWQNYPFNVHYRCDEIGNCTLSRGGASAIAKLTR